MGPNGFSRSALNLFVFHDQSAPIHVANDIPFDSSQRSQRGGQDALLATTDERRRAVGLLNPKHVTIESTCREKEGTTPVTTHGLSRRLLKPPTSWEVKVMIKSTIKSWVICVCVLHIKPFFLPIDIEHNQCPCRLFNPRRDISYVVTWSQSYATEILRFHVSMQ